MSLSDLAFRDLHKRIRVIPHLDTGIRFDAEKLRAEWDALPKSIIKPYDSKSEQREMAEKVNSHWHGASFTSTSGTTQGNMSEMGLEPRHTYKTPLCDLMPYAASCVFSLGKGTMNNVNRLMVMRAGGHLTWHSHWWDYDHGDRGRIVLQIPIVIPPKFEYEVINIFDWKFGDHGKNGFPKIYKEWYPPGHLWHFDSYNIHNVHNRDTTDRVTLMMYVDMSDDYVGQILDQAERKYEGIRFNHLTK